MPSRCATDAAGVWWRAGMEFHHLRYFVAAAEELNFSRAAVRAHVSQPALSRAIAELERALGAALFDRSRRNMQLTEAGRFALPRARRLLCDAATLVQQTKERFAAGRRQVRIGFMAPFADDVVAPAMRRLRAQQPRWRIALFELSPRAQLDRLRNHELDAALVGNLEARDREVFGVRRLASYPMAALLPQDHPLAKRKKLALAALASEPFVTLSDATFPERSALLREACALAGFTPTIGTETDSLAHMITTVASGEGVALIPRHCEKLPHRGATFVALAERVAPAEILLVVPQAGDREVTATVVSAFTESAAPSRDAGTRRSARP
jgi:DNA-binding transcriptional LysR family regulator